MTELRIVITAKLDKILDEVIEAGLFASKADAVRAATIYFLKDLGWLEKPSRNKREPLRRKLKACLNC